MKHNPCKKSQDILGGFALVFPMAPGCLEAIPSLPELLKVLRALPALPAPSLPGQTQLSEVHRDNNSLRQSRELSDKRHSQLNITTLDKAFRPGFPYQDLKKKKNRNEKIFSRAASEGNKQFKQVKKQVCTDGFSPLCVSRREMERSGGSRLLLCSQRQGKVTL